MKNKLTGWYEPEQKPVRQGFYECKCCNFKFYWNGKNWMSKNFYGQIAQIRDGWRGLTKNVDS